jgi:hypothetical protein
VVKLGKEGRFQDTLLQKDVKNVLTQLEEAMVAFERKETKAPAEMVTADLARVPVSISAQCTDSRDAALRWLVNS